MIAGRATAAGYHAGGLLNQQVADGVAERFLLPFSKGGFSFLGKNLRDREMGCCLNVAVQVCELITKTSG
jgi:hypothetical protein